MQRERCRVRAVRCDCGYGNNASSIRARRPGAVAGKTFSSSYTRSRIVCSAYLLGMAPLPGCLLSVLGLILAISLTMCVGQGLASAVVG